jgi:hypothetical protein
MAMAARRAGTLLVALALLLAWPRAAAAAEARPDGAPPAGKEQPAPAPAPATADTARAPDAPHAPPPADSTASAPSRLRPWVVIGLGGLAGAMAALGVIHQVAWQDRVSSFDSMRACGSSQPERGGSTCNQLYDEGTRAKLVAVVSYGLAGALGATAVIVHMTAPSRGREARKVACAVSPLAPGIGCTLRF